MKKYFYVQFFILNHRLYIYKKKKLFLYIVNLKTLSYHKNYKKFLLIVLNFIWKKKLYDCLNCKSYKLKKLYVKFYF